MTIKNKQLRQISAVLASDPRITAAFLLGSAAREKLRKDSDIDIAILPAPDQTLNALDRVDLAVKLEAILGREIDLGILDHKNLIYAKEAYLTGQRVYCRNAFQCGLFGASALGLYAEMREARKEVEHAYQAG